MKQEKFRHSQSAIRTKTNPLSSFRIADCGWQIFLLFAGLAASSGDVRAEAPPKEEPPGFLLTPEMQLAHLTALTMGSGAAPSVGILNSLTVLHSGEELHLWTIAPPFLDKAIRTQVGTGLLALSGFDGQLATLNGLAWLRLGDKLDFWTLINTDEIQKVPRDWLLRVTDETPLADPEKNDVELDAYFQMLISAGQTSDKAFYAQARRDLTYRHLMERPRKYRGEVVYLQGRLRRLEKQDAPAMLRQAGVKFVYEAWFFINNNGAAPVCALFTELPPGLKMGEKLNAEVGFAGYLYKKYRYGSGITGKQVRFAPLLLGRMPHDLSLPTDPADENDPNQGLLPLFMSLVAGTFLAVILLSLYFRSNDLKVRQALALMNRQDFVLPGSEENRKVSGDPVTNDPLETTNGNEGSDWLPLPSPISQPEPRNVNQNPAK
jgi:hypothetical protein